jgi:tRNA A-37 threonylcarbamoyl transferase component Bud32
MNVGQTLEGRYELEERVGEGGMSAVYRARDTVLDRQVAIKVLHEHFSRDAEYVERFRREARAIAKLTHPNIVTVIDRGEVAGRQFIVFEHVPGETLKYLVAREGPLSTDRALALAHQIGRALAFAHEVGIVHRDVKPQNVLIDQDGSAKVTDFGIARTLDIEDSLTESGTVLGTSDYIAPEQASSEPVDERSDQYSLGVVLYELLTGELPFPGSNPMAVAMRHLRDPVPRVRAKRPEVPPRVDAIVARAMAKRPRDRFPSMEAMTAALEAALAAERKSPVGVPEEDTGVLPLPAATGDVRDRRPAKPRWRVVALLLLAAGALVAGLFVAQMGREDGILGGGGGDGSAGGPVRLGALSDYDPEGDGQEHPEDVAAATDGDASTYWTTETYSSFDKSGVGLVLEAPTATALSRLVVVTDEPGFTARVRASASQSGDFVDVSDEETVGARTAFSVDTGGKAYRYYLLWITDPNGRAHVNELRARAAS